MPLSRQRTGTHDRTLVHRTAHYPYPHTIKMGQNGVTGQLGFVFVMERKKGGGTWQIVTKKLDDDDDNDSTKGEKKKWGILVFLCVS